MLSLLKWLLAHRRSLIFGKQRGEDGTVVIVGEDWRNRVPSSSGKTILLVLNKIYLSTPSRSN